MPRSRVGISTPAILLTLLVLAAGSALFLDQISSYVGSVEGRGALTYTYIGGTEPITTIVFELPPELSGALVPESPGGSVRLDDDRLVVSARLNPGERLQVDYYLTRYVEPGPRAYTARATTQSGETLVTQGSMQVPSTGILRVLGLVRPAPFPAGPLLLQVSHPIGVFLWSLISLAAMALTSAGVAGRGMARAEKGAEDFVQETVKKAEDAAKKASEAARDASKQVAEAKPVKASYRIITRIGIFLVSLFLIYGVFSSIQNVLREQSALNIFVLLGQLGVLLIAVDTGFRKIRER